MTQTEIAKWIVLRDGCYGISCRGGEGGYWDGTKVAVCVNVSTACPIFDAVNQTCSARFGKQKQAAQAWLQKNGEKV